MNMKQSTSNYPNASAMALAQAQAQAQAGAQVKPDGAFTQRIRLAAERAEYQASRLINVLRHLRVPPPEPQDARASGLNAVHTTVEENLNRQQNAMDEIEAAISELEGLFS